MGLRISPMRLALFLLCTVIPGSVHGGSECEYAAGGWNEEDAKCQDGFTEVFKEEQHGQTLRYCCDEKHKDFLPHMLNKGGECRATECGAAATPNLCPTLHSRTVNGKVVENYEEILREPCTTESGSAGVVGLCCVRNSTEGVLATIYGAEQNEFPHMAKLKLPGHCGGTIYNKRWIVTAAHCIVDEETYKVSDPNEMEVILGTNLGDQKSKEYIYKVKRAIPHPKYSRLEPNEKIFNDIALLELDRDIVFGKKVKSLEIAPKGFKPLQYARKAVIVGWGTTDTLDLSLHLQKANFLIRRDEVCFKEGPHSDMTGMENQLLCVGGILKGKWSPTAGGGDSGGPAICRGPDGKALLCGVTSYGGSDEDCAAHQDEENCPPSVHAEVAHFSGWIKKVAGKQDPKTFHKPWLYGEPVIRGQYEHQVHITSTDGTACGGTLVSPDMVVTAAHCVYTPEKKKRPGVKVTTGIIDLRKKGKVFGVKSSARDPYFERVGEAIDLSKQGNRIRMTDSYYKNNLAVLKLNGKVDIPPNKLPQLPSKIAPFGYELGFPRNSTKTQLTSRPFRFLDSAECQTRMDRMSRTGMNIKVDKDLLCGVEMYSGGSTCDRELGGGVICRNKDGKDVLCGVQVFRLCEWSIPNGFINMVMHKVMVETLMKKL